MAPQEQQPPGRLAEPCRAPSQQPFRGAPRCSRGPLTAGPTADARPAGAESANAGFRAAGARSARIRPSRGDAQVAAPPAALGTTLGVRPRATLLPGSGTPATLAHVQRAPRALTLPSPGSATPPHEEGAGRMGGATRPPHEPLPKAVARTRRRPQLRTRRGRHFPSGLERDAPALELGAHGGQEAAGRGGSPQVQRMDRNSGLAGGTGGQTPGPMSEPRPVLPSHAHCHDSQFRGPGKPWEAVRQESRQ